MPEKMFGLYTSGVSFTGYYVRRNCVTVETWVREVIVHWVGTFCVRQSLSQITLEVLPRSSSWARDPLQIVWLSSFWLISWFQSLIWFGAHKIQVVSVDYLDCHSANNTKQLPVNYCLQGTLKL